MKHEKSFFKKFCLGLKSSEDHPPDKVLGVMWFREGLRIAKGIFFGKRAKIKNLIESEKITACIIIPSLAATEISPWEVGNFKEFQVRQMMQALFSDKKNGSLDVKFYDPGIKYICSYLESDEDFEDVDANNRIDILAKKLFSCKIKDEYIKEIGKNLCWDYYFYKNIWYIFYDLPISVINKIRNNLPDNIKTILGSLVLYFSRDISEFLQKKLYSKKLKISLYSKANRTETVSNP